MSRHDLAPSNPRHLVVVGWDPPLQTFFGQVLDTATGDGEDDIEVVWIGTRFGEILDPMTVIAAVRPFAAIPDGLLQVLQRDRKARPYREADPQAAQGP